jgi:stage III sporulation protein AH
MKKIFKKNQVIVTALAIMIAVAGYLHFSKENLELTTEETLKTQADEFYEDDLLTSSEDILSDDTELVASADDASDTDATYSDTEVNADESDTEVADETVEDVNTEATEDLEDSESTDTEDTTETEETEAVPGDSILTSATSTSNMIKEAKLNKEQLRSKNEATLKEIINSETLTDVEKQDAVDAMVKITENSEKEEAAELLLEAKGYANSIVTMDEDSVDVVVDLAEMSDTQRAQIEEVVSRKTGVPISNIVITPVVNN